MNKTSGSEWCVMFKNKFLFESKWFNLFQYMQANSHLAHSSRLVRYRDVANAKSATRATQIKKKERKK